MKTTRILFLIFKILTWQACNASIQPCVFEYNSAFIQEGEIYSPNYPSPYPNNLNCRYEFYGRENELIILSAEDFQLESPQSTSHQDINFMDFIETRGGAQLDQQQQQQPPPQLVSNNKTGPFTERQCFYDFVDVFSTDNHGSAKWRSRHCGNNFGERIVSQSPTLILVFQTDRMLAYKGFRFHFAFSNLNIFPLVTEPVCGPSEISGYGGSLASPNYPLAFEENTDCAWTITVEQHEKILIKFNDINFAESCKYSYISIWDGYVLDVAKPDLSVCEQLKYYHKGFMQFNSKSNRVVISFIGNKKVNKIKASSSSKISQPVKRHTNDFMSKMLNKTLDARHGFKLTWTAVYVSDECAEFQCHGGEYCIDSNNMLCQKANRYCIAKSLKCDGIFNCDHGDESDEKGCNLEFLPPNFALMALAGTIAVLILLLLSLVVCKINSKTSKRDTDDLNYEYKQAARLMPAYTSSPVEGLKEKASSTSLNNETQLLPTNLNGILIVQENSHKEKLFDNIYDCNIDLTNSCSSSLVSIPHIDQYNLRMSKSQSNHQVKNLINNKLTMSTSLNESLNKKKSLKYDKDIPRSNTFRRNSYTMAIFENN